MPQVVDIQDALVGTEELTERQAALAAGIRHLGNPEYDELAQTLEENVRTVNQRLRELTANGTLKREVMDQVDVEAIHRVHEGRVSGGTSVEAFATEFGIDPQLR